MTPFDGVPQRACEGGPLCTRVHNTLCVPFGYTKGHLHTRVEGHRQKASSIYRHYCKERNTAVPNNFLARFNVIKKCTDKFDCLVNEMLCIQYLKPALNVQSDSLRAKVFM